jgi:hypothetical protein
MRRGRLYALWLLPPVILAALFIWAVAGQIKYRTVRASVLRLYGSVQGMEEGERGQRSGPDGDRMIAAADSENAFLLPGEVWAGQEAAGAPGAEGTSGSGSQGAPKDAGDDWETGEITLLFAGDIYLSDHVLNAYDQAGGIAGVLDEGLRDEIAAADLFIANQEFPFSDRGAPAADKQFTFRLPPARLTVLEQMGVDLVTLANNHTLDYGQDALLDTCALLDGAGIVRIGAGADISEAARAKILEVKGKRIGFLAASRVYPDGSWAASDTRPGVMSAYDPAMLLEAIRTLRPACDYLVVYVHWGIERNTSPEAYQTETGRQYIDAGADLVVGSHPHVLQGIEYYKGKPILYSLGNFVFGSSIPETMLVRVELGEGTGALSLVPAVSSAGFTRQMDAAKQEDFFRRMEEMSTGVQIEGGAVLPSNHSP